MPASVTQRVNVGFFQQNISLNKYTTWNIGGPASYFCEPSSISELREGLSFARQRNLDWVVIGNGSNILAPDNGFSGLVIRIGPKFSRVLTDDGVITVQSGAPLCKLADIANDYDCSCFNFTTGIPGTVGGAVAMNAGAFGYEVGDFLTRVVYVTQEGELKEIKNLGKSFTYRTSPFQDSSKIVLSAQLDLDFSADQPGMSEILSIRRNKMPYSAPSAGSVFKNPAHTKKTAGEMLDIVGAKGMRVGDAAVSHRHANFIVNKGHATAENVRNLIDILLERVYKEFGVTLVTEIKVI